jgi:hypothetical protein
MMEQVPVAAVAVAAARVAREELVDLAVADHLPCI